MSGNGNTAVGTSALRSNTTGYENVSVGQETLLSNTTGSLNTAVGRWAMSSNTSGYSNTAMGDRAMLNNTTGYENVAVGIGALSGNSTGLHNVAVGPSALNAITTGNGNVGIGDHAGPTSNYYNTIAIGTYAQPTASNRAKIGDNFIQQIGGAVGWSNLSDARFKTSVRRNVPGVDFIKKLRPVTFKWDVDKLDEFGGYTQSIDGATEAARAAKREKVQTGFLAQEVEKAADECGFDFSAVVKPPNHQSTYELTYAEFVVPLVAAVQEQQAELEKLRATATRLSAGDQNAQGAEHAGLMGDTAKVCMLAGLLFGLVQLRERSARA